MLALVVAWVAVVQPGLLLVDLQYCAGLGGVAGTLIEHAQRSLGRSIDSGDGDEGWVTHAQLLCLGDQS